MIKNAIRVPGRTDPLEYHKAQDAKRGEPKFIMSSGQLRDFDKCPEKWLLDTEDKKTASMDFGSLLDTFMLTPELFNSHYVVSPEFYPANARSSAVVEGEASVGDDLPWDNKVTFCKNWRKEQDPALEPISFADLKDVEFAKRRLMSKPTIKAFLEASDTQVKCVAEWHDEETELVIPLQILLDLVPGPDTEFNRSLGDFKTARCAALIPFQNDAVKMGYHVQAALYIDVYNAATGENRCDYENDDGSWAFLLAENLHPFQPAKRVATKNFIDTGRMQYKQMLRNYCQCLKYGKWPDYDMTDESIGDWGQCDIMPWQAERAMFAPKFDFTPPQEAEAGEPDPDLIP